MHHDEDCLLGQIQHRLPLGINFSGALLQDAPITAAYPGEAAAVANAVLSRKREFFAGRWHARTALKALGGPAIEIAVGPDRAPIWPDGFVGSISHCHDYCAAIAGARADFAGLGLDIDSDVPLSQGVSEMILHPMDTCTSGVVHSKLCFVIKEAVYKALYCITARFLSFEAVSLVIDPAQHRFQATLHDAISREIVGRMHFAGSYVHTPGHFAAALAITTNQVGNPT